MTEEKYAKPQTQEKAGYELAGGIVQPIRKVQLRGFPIGELFTVLHPDYRSFRDLEINRDN
jgi:hypothetical protein